MKVKFIMGPGQVLDSVYERAAVLEHMGKVRLEINTVEYLPSVA